MTHGTHHNSGTYIHYSHSTVPGIYGSIYKQTESEGVAQEQGLFTIATNPWPPITIAIKLFVYM